VRLAGAALLFLVALALIPVRPNLLRVNRLDFGIAVYYPARAFLDGLDPYDQSAYRAAYPVEAPLPPFLPATLLLHLPFGLLPPGPSAALYLGDTLVLILATGWLALGFIERERPPLAAIVLVAAMIVLSRPGRLVLRLGQLSFEPVVGTYTALRYALLAPWLSGLGVALALIKPTFGIPLAALMAGRRHWRAVAIGLAITAAINLPVAMVLAHRDGGISTLASHFGDTWEASRLGIVETENPDMTSLRADAPSLIGRIRGHPLPAGAQSLVGLVILALAVGVLRRSNQCEGSPRGGWDALLAGFICLAILSSGYHQTYDLVLLALPALVLLRDPVATVVLSRSVRLILLGLLAIIACNYAASDGALARLGMTTGTRGWHFVTSINAVALLLVFGVYAVGILNARRMRPGASG
jgi:Glycosyltransferase family 87